MTAIDSSVNSDAFATSCRRALVVLRDVEVADGAKFAGWLRQATTAARIGDMTVTTYLSTGGYHPDPARPQEFESVASAVQMDYRQEDEFAILRFLADCEAEAPIGDTTISVGTIVTCLPPSGPSLLLLGARRRQGMTPDDFGHYWSHNHAPRAMRELQEAPVPIGYELFLVDHGLSSSAANITWRAGAVDGWMHITSHGPSDFATIARDPEHRAWVLEDEANFVDFAAPMVGQQMLAVS